MADFRSVNEDMVDEIYLKVKLSLEHLFNKSINSE